MFFRGVLFHFIDGLSSLGRDAHDLRCNAHGFEGVEEFHARNGVVYFANQWIALLNQIVNNLLESTHGQLEGEMLYSAGRIFSQVVMEHTLTGKRLNGVS